MDHKEFDRCLRNLLVTAVNGRQISNAQIIGTLELMKLDLHSMMQAQRDAKPPNIVAVAPIVPAGR